MELEGPERAIATFTSMGPNRRGHADQRVNLVLRVHALENLLYSSRSDARPTRVRP